jgi:hypothetical protein
VATINRVRAARLNPLIAREIERESGNGPDRSDFPFWLRPPACPTDPYLRRGNVCLACNTVKALGTGECLCAQ